LENAPNAEVTDQMQPVARTVTLGLSGNGGEVRSKGCIRPAMVLACGIPASDAIEPPSPQCSTNPVGTVELVITPEPGELPIKCYDSGNNGNLCMYSADFYIAAHYRGAWFNKTGYAWTPVDISRIPAVTAWPPWSGTGSMGYEINVGELNLNTSKFDPPPEGFEVYAGIAPAGSAAFAPGMVAKVYPVPPDG